MRDDKLTSLEEAASLVTDGSSLAIASPGIGPEALVPMALVRELVRQKVRNLSLFAPSAQIEADLLIGAGCVSEIHFFGFNLFGTGAGPCYKRASAEGSIVTREQSEFTIWLGVLAGSLGVEFIPLRGYENDLLRDHAEWPTFPSPFDGKELVAISAVVPDVSVLHVPRADRFGNAQLGKTNRYNVLAEFTATRLVQASKRAILTAEEIVPTEDLRGLSDPADLLSHDVDAVVQVSNGAHPYGLVEGPEPDVEHIQEYIRAAQTPDLFEKYLLRYVTEPDSHASYLDRVGIRA